MTSPAAETSGASPKRPQPDPEEIGAELERILQSECFQHAARAKEFLRFVVQRTLAGEGDRLKGYLIAVDVFGRPDDFDAQSDPLVRVEAGRLRRRLIEYYATEGSSDSVQIELPRGGYVPEFRYAAAEPSAPKDPPPRWRWLRNAVVLAVTALLAALLVVQWHGNAVRPPAQVESETASSAGTAKPRVLVLPFGCWSGSLSS